MHYIKLVVLGDSKVGKTSLIKQLVGDELKFEPEIETLAKFEDEQDRLDSGWLNKLNEHEAKLEQSVTTKRLASLLASQMNLQQILLRQQRDARKEKQLAPRDIASSSVQSDQLVSSDNRKNDVSVSSSIRHHNGRKLEQSCNRNVTVPIVNQGSSIKKLDAQSLKAKPDSVMQQHWQSTASVNAAGLPNGPQISGSESLNGQAKSLTPERSTTDEQKLGPTILISRHSSGSNIGEDSNWLSRDHQPRSISSCDFGSSDGNDATIISDPTRNGVQMREGSTETKLHASASKAKDSVGSSKPVCQLKEVEQKSKIIDLRANSGDTKISRLECQECGTNQSGQLRRGMKTNPDEEPKSNAHHVSPLACSHRLDQNDKPIGATSDKLEGRAAITSETKTSIKSDLKGQEESRAKTSTKRAPNEDPSRCSSKAEAKSSGLSQKSVKNQSLREKSSTGFHLVAGKQQHRHSYCGPSDTNCASDDMSQTSSTTAATSRQQTELSKQAKIISILFTPRSAVNFSNNPSEQQTSGSKRAQLTMPALLRQYQRRLSNFHQASAGQQQAQTSSSSQMQQQHQVQPNQQQAQESQRSGGATKRLGETMEREQSDLMRRKLARKEAAMIGEAARAAALLATAAASAAQSLMVHGSAYGSNEADSNGATNQLIPLLRGHGMSPISELDLGQDQVNLLKLTSEFKQRLAKDMSTQPTQQSSHGASKNPYNGEQTSTAKTKQADLRHLIKRSFLNYVNNLSLYEIEIIDMPTIEPNQFPSSSIAEWSLFKGRSHLLTADAYLLVFDLTRPSSIHYIKMLRDKIFESREMSTTPVYVIANKADLCPTLQPSLEARRIQSMSVRHLNQQRLQQWNSPQSNQMDRISGSGSSMDTPGQRSIPAVAAQQLLTAYKSNRFRLASHGPIASLRRWAKLRGAICNDQTQFSFISTSKYPNQAQPYLVQQQQQALLSSWLQFNERAHRINYRLMLGAISPPGGLQEGQSGGFKLAGTGVLSRLKGMVRNRFRTSKHNSDDDSDLQNGSVRHSIRPLVSPDVRQRRLQRQLRRERKRRAKAIEKFQTSEDDEKSKISKRRRRRKRRWRKHKKLGRSLVSRLLLSNGGRSKSQKGRAQSVMRVAARRRSSVATTTVKERFLTRWMRGVRGQIDRAEKAQGELESFEMKRDRKRSDGGLSQYTKLLTTVAKPSVKIDPTPVAIELQTNDAKVLTLSQAGDRKPVEHVCGSMETPGAKRTFYELFNRLLQTSSTQAARTQLRMVAVRPSSACEKTKKLPRQATQVGSPSKQGNSKEQCEAKVSASKQSKSRILCSGVRKDHHQQQNSTRRKSSSTGAVLWQTLSNYALSRGAKLSVIGGGLGKSQKQQQHHNNQQQTKHQALREETKEICDHDPDNEANGRKPNGGVHLGTDQYLSADMLRKLSLISSNSQSSAIEGSELVNVGDPDRGQCELQPRASSALETNILMNQMKRNSNAALRASGSKSADSHRQAQRDQTSTQSLEEKPNGVEVDGTSRSKRLWCRGMIKRILMFQSGKGLQANSRDSDQQQQQQQQQSSDIIASSPEAMTQDADTQADGPKSGSWAPACKDVACSVPNRSQMKRSQESSGQRRQSLAVCDGPSTVAYPSIRIISTGSSMSLLSSNNNGSHSSQLATSSHSIQQDEHLPFSDEEREEFRGDQEGSTAEVELNLRDQQRERASQDYTSEGHPRLSPSSSFSSTLSNSVSLCMSPPPQRNEERPRPESAAAVLLHHGRTHSTRAVETPNCDVEAHKSSDTSNGNRAHNMWMTLNSSCSNRSKTEQGQPQQQQLNASCLYQIGSIGQLRKLSADDCLLIHRAQERSMSSGAMPSPTEPLNGSRADESESDADGNDEDELARSVEDDRCQSGTLDSADRRQSVKQSIEAAIHHLLVPRAKGSRSASITLGAADCTQINQRHASPRISILSAVSVHRTWRDWRQLLGKKKAAGVGNTATDEPCGANRSTSDEQKVPNVLEDRDNTSLCDINTAGEPEGLKLGKAVPGIVGFLSAQTAFSELSSELKRETVINFDQLMKINQLTLTAANTIMLSTSSAGSPTHGASAQFAATTGGEIVNDLSLNSTLKPYSTTGLTSAEIHCEQLATGDNTPVSARDSLGRSQFTIKNKMNSSNNPMQTRPSRSTVKYRPASAVLLSEAMQGSTSAMMKSANGEPYERSINFTDRSIAQAGIEQANLNLTELKISASEQIAASAASALERQKKRCEKLSEILEPRYDKKQPGAQYPLLESYDLNPILKDLAQLVRKHWKCNYIECSAANNWNIKPIIAELTRALECNRPGLTVLNHKENEQDNMMRHDKQNQVVGSLSKTSTSDESGLSSGSYDTIDDDYYLDGSSESEEDSSSQSSDRSETSSSSSERFEDVSRIANSCRNSGEARKAIKGKSRKFFKNFRVH